MTFLFPKVAILCIFVSVFTVFADDLRIPLERIANADKGSSVTVSGISSGGYMAVQMHIAHSKSINGSAIFAGGPFYCAESNLEFAQYKCMDNTLGLPETQKLVALTYTDASLGLVDPPRNLANDKVYLFSGKADTVVKQPVAKALRDYYESFQADVAADFDVEAEHCLPTLAYGEECATLSSPYLGKCDFDGAGRALQHLFYGELSAAGPSAAAGVGANLFAFDQTPFFVNDGLSSLGGTGYIYIPSNCQVGAATGSQCKLHISFHGCKQGIDRIGDEYAAHSGFNPWAEANDIVVLYPYAKVSNTIPLNPNGCWDWWAYTGADYGVKTGVQVRFVAALAKKLGWEL